MGRDGPLLSVRAAECGSRGGLTGARHLVGAVALAKATHRTYMWPEIAMDENSPRWPDDEEWIKRNESRSWAMV